MGNLLISQVFYTHIVNARTIKKNILSEINSLTSADIIHSNSRINNGKQHSRYQRIVRNMKKLTLDKNNVKNILVSKIQKVINGISPTSKHLWKKSHDKLNNYIKNLVNIPGSLNWEQRYVKPILQEYFNNKNMTNEDKLNGFKTNQKIYSLTNYLKKQFGGWSVLQIRI